MPDKLDEKLYDIICPDIDGPIKSVEQIELAVAEIKQALRAHLEPLLEEEDVSKLTGPDYYTAMDQNALRREWKEKLKL